MTDTGSPGSVDRELLQWMQDDFPIRSSPWDDIAGRLNIPVDEVLLRVRTLSAEGVIRSFRAFVNPHNTGSRASTLVGLKVPEDDIGRIVPIVNRCPGVTHNYLREHEYNIWFTLTERDEPALRTTLAEMNRRTGLPGSAILDLRTVRLFKVDVRFPMTGNDNRIVREPEPVRPVFPLAEQDHALLRSTQEGIPPVPEPFRAIAMATGIPEEEVIFRLKALHQSGMIRRIGISVNQRKLGIVANALVAWKIPGAAVERAGPLLSSYAEISHCYERRIVPGRWEYNIFTVMHGHDRQSVNTMAETIADTLGLRPYIVLFSTNQFKRTSLVHEFPRILREQPQRARV